MSIVKIDRPSNDEPTEIENYLQATLEIAVFRRLGWQQRVTSRLVQILGLLNKPTDGAQRLVEGGAFRALLQNRIDPIEQLLAEKERKTNG